MKNLIVIALSSVLLSCGALTKEEQNPKNWSKKQEEKFLDGCTSSFIASYERSGQKADRAQVEDFCKCSLEQIKADEVTAQEITEMSESELQEYSKSCVKEVFGVDI